MTHMPHIVLVLTLAVSASIPAQGQTSPQDAKLESVVEYDAALAAVDKVSSSGQPLSKIGAVPKIEDGEVVETVPLDLTGWTPGDAIYFVIQSTKGFAGPDNGSVVVFKADDWYGPRDCLRVADCAGEWA